ncbi:MAG: FAD-dependent oxidoreductase [Pseudomonadota bacterium]
MSGTGNGRRRRVVLVGGGHAHALVLLDYARRPLEDTEVLLVAGEMAAPYSGMLPGLVAGRFTHDECHIDLPKLALAAGATAIAGRVVAVDHKAGLATLADGRVERFDVISIDVGITPDLGGIEGAEAHGIAVKPISSFFPKWQALTARAEAEDLPSLAIIGGGAAGFELALAARETLGARVEIDLVAGGRLMAGLGARVGRLGRAALKRNAITLIEQDRAAAVTPDGVVLASGTRLDAAAVMVTTGAQPAPWFAASGLPLSPAGYLAARPTLQLTGCDTVLAAGDCVDVLAHPRPKAGVIAVRQGPPLAENIRRLVRGEPALPFAPQRRWLQLLTSGPGTAIAAWGGIAVETRWALAWKDRIDRAFMHAFETVSR